MIAAVCHLSLLVLVLGVVLGFSSLVPSLRLGRQRRRKGAGRFASASKPCGSRIDDEDKDEDEDDDELLYCMKKVGCL